MLVDLLKIALKRKLSEEKLEMSKKGFSEEVPIITRPDYFIAMINRLYRDGWKIVGEEGLYGLRRDGIKPEKGCLENGYFWLKHKVSRYNLQGELVERRISLPMPENRVLMKITNYNPPVRLVGDKIKEIINC